MTFEEFFIKKRIDLPALEKAEPSLFSEFKTHFFQMGEKSFDHTKKYWFNKLRHQFHLVPEVKVEKPAIVNPLAQQTITESLTEPVAAPQPAKQGFVPRFKAANIAQPLVENNTAEKPLNAEPSTVPTPAKPGFTPRFKAANMPTPVVTEDKPEKKTSETESTPQPQPSKPGFRPRFKAANPPKPVVTEDKPEEKTSETESTPQPQPSKPGFTPRFKAANPPKSAVTEDKPEEKPVEADPIPGEKPTETTTPKPAYKPRFNMKNLPPKKEE